MTDRQDRSDRLRKRFEGDDESADSDGESSDEGPQGNRESGSAEGESGEQSESGGEASASETGDGSASSVKDRPSVLMYLPEETRQELDIRFDELNARYKREHGEPLEKNRDYYPAVIQAGLEDRNLEDVLEL